MLRGDTVPKSNLRNVIPNRYHTTSMHTSRMRTACLLPVSPSMHCAGGCLLLGGVCSWGVTAPWGVSVPGGVYSVGGMCIPACTEADTLL